MEASPRLELGVRILQTLALPLGYDADYFYGAGLVDDYVIHGSLVERVSWMLTPSTSAYGAGDGIRTRDFHLGKVTLYH